MQNAAMQNAATRAASREHANFTPCVLRRECMYFRRSEPIHFVDFRVVDTSHQNPAAIPAGWRIAVHGHFVE